MNNIYLLDCTLRDGGLGLEDAHKNDVADIKFESVEVRRIVSQLSMSKMDIIELGSIEITEDDRTGYAIYKNVEAISKTIPKRMLKDQLFVGLYRGPDTPIAEIPEWKPGLVDGLRVIIRYSELQKSLDFCAALSEKGYKVFVQPMLTMRYTNDEIDKIIRASNEMNAFALYFVDSYGYMEQEDVKRLFHIYDKGLNEKIKIGFHAHNNMNLAYANALEFIKISGERDIIVDCCVEGMGQGAGNLQTELIIPYMNRNYNKSYMYSMILDICEDIEHFLPDSVWGYSPMRLLPAIHRCAYKYAVRFRVKYHLAYREIDYLLNLIPAEKKHRYVPEWADEIYNITFGDKKKW